MTKKFDPKIFTAKQIWAPVPGSKGIRRRFAWNESKARYEDPPGGALYEARRTDLKGLERTSRTFSTLQCAREWKDRRDAQFPLASPEKAKEVTYTVAQLIEDFKAKRFTFLSEGTIIHYEKRFRYFTPLLPMNVDSITPRDITNWIDWLKGPERKIQCRGTRISFEKELKALGTLLKWHIEESDDQKLVFPIKRKHSQRARVRRRKTKPVVLSETELDQWLSALKEDGPLFYSIALVQVAQALRVSEVCAMKWSFLDLENGRYEIREHVVWPRVGRRPPRLSPGTKSREDSYWIPLWENVQLELGLLRSTRQSDLVFTEDGSLLTYRRVQYAYDKAFAKAGLPHRGTHVCRHTGSTLFLDKTQDLLALQQLGGWRNQHMPQHYAKIRSQRAESAMRESERRLKLVGSTNESTG